MLILAHLLTFLPRALDASEPVLAGWFALARRKRPITVRPFADARATVRRPRGADGGGCHALEVLKVLEVLEVLEVLARGCVSTFWRVPFIASPAPTTTVIHTSVPTAW